MTPDPKSKKGIEPKFEVVELEDFPVSQRATAEYLPKLEKFKKTIEEGKGVRLLLPDDKKLARAWQAGYYDASLRLQMKTQVTTDKETGKSYLWIRKATPEELAKRKKVKAE